MNRWVLLAAVTERGSLRYTPAGLPVTDLVLSHESVVTQEGQARKVSVQVKAVAFGALSDAVNRLTLGAPTQFAGFLATSRNGRGLTYHITDVLTATEGPSTHP